MSVSSPIVNFAKRHGLQLLLIVAGATLGVGLKGLAESDAVLIAIVLVLTALTFATLVIFAGAAYGELQHINESIANLGVEIEAELTADANEHKSMDQDPMHRAMMEAKHELLVFDLLSPSGKRPEFDSWTSQLYENVGPAILDLARRLGKGFRYERVVQSPNPPTPFLNVKDKILIRHLAGMLDLRDQGHPAVIVKIAPVKYPYKFFLIDQHDAILQLHQLNAKGEAITWCEVLIRNVPRQLMNVFEQMWIELQNANETRVAMRSDFPAAT